MEDKFCTNCGRKNEIKLVKSSEYDPKTGEGIYHKVNRCPLYGGLFGNYDCHDDYEMEMGENYSYLRATSYDKFGNKLNEK